MLSQENLAQVRELLAAGEIKKAITALLSWSKDMDKEIYNEVILLSGQYKKFTKDQLLGLNSKQTDGNRILHALLKLVDRLEHPLEEAEAADVAGLTEDEVWEKAIAEDNAENFKNYLRLFPAGEYIFPAIRKITQYQAEKEKTNILEVEHAPFVSRQLKLARLGEHFLALEDKHKLSLAFITGETGTGKTSLYENFIRQTLKVESSVVPFRASCDRFSGEDSPYKPFKILLQQILDREVPELLLKLGTEHRFNPLFPFAVETFLESIPEFNSELLPRNFLVGLLADYMSEEHPVLEKLRIDDESNASDPIEVDDGFLLFLKSLSSFQPLVLIIDDMQWIDESSLKLISQIVLNLTDFPIYVIGAYDKSEIKKASEGEEYSLTEFINLVREKCGDVWIDLSNISEENNRIFIDEFLDLDKNEFSEEFRDQLLQITGGNPLFTSELVNYLKTTGIIFLDENASWQSKTEIEWTELPAKIEAVMNKRVAQLDEGIREILSVASIQGRSFLPQVIARILEKDEKQLLHTCIRELQKEFELIYEEKPIRFNKQLLSFFRFSNTILQQFLYNDLSQTERMLFHQQIADVLEEIYQGDLDIVADDLAVHYDLAEDKEKCIHYLEKAGRSSSRLCSYEAAANKFSRALELLGDLEQTDENLKTRLRITTALSICYRSQDGWSSPKAIDLSNEAIQLGEQIGAVEETSTALFGSWVQHLLQLDLEKSLEVAENFLALGLKKPDRFAIVLKGRIACANSLLWMGKVNEALEHIMALKEKLGETSGDEAHVESGQDPRALVDGFLMICQWKTGRVGEARKTAANLLESARTWNHTYSLAIVITHVLWLNYLLDGQEDLETDSHELINIATESKIAFYRGFGKLFAGVARIRADEIAAGHSLVEDGYHEDIAVDGTHMMHSVYVMIHAEGHLKEKNYGIAKEELLKAITFSKEKQELLHLSDMYNLLAEVLLAAGDQEGAAEACRSGLESLCIGTEEANFNQLRLLVNLVKAEGKAGNEEALNKCLDKLAGEEAEEEYQAAKETLT